jgi:hypothetical protein
VLDENFYSLYAEQVDVTFIEKSDQRLLQKQMITTQSKSGVGEFYDNYQNSSMKVIDIPSVEMMKSIQQQENKLSFQCFEIENGDNFEI